MNEAKFTTRLVKWMNANQFLTSALEIKITKGKSVPLAALAEHQRRALEKASSGCLTWKISDGSGMQTPFDVFVLNKVPAYVVLYFYERGERSFYMIDIDSWNRMSTEADRKSVTEEMAQQYGTTYMF